MKDFKIFVKMNYYSVKMGAKLILSTYFIFMFFYLITFIGNTNKNIGDLNLMIMLTWSIILLFPFLPFLYKDKKYLIALGIINHKSFDFSIFLIYFVLTFIMAILPIEFAIYFKNYYQLSYLISITSIVLINVIYKCSLSEKSKDNFSSIWFCTIFVILTQFLLGANIIKNINKGLIQGLILTGLILIFIIQVTIKNKLYDKEKVYSKNKKPLEEKEIHLKKVSYPRLILTMKLWNSKKIQYSYL